MQTKRSDVEAHQESEGEFELNWEKNQEEEHHLTPAKQAVRDADASFKKFRKLLREQIQIDG